MYIDLSEEEAHVLILKALNLDGDATIKKRGDLHILNSQHTINIRRRPLKIEDIDDSAFKVDGDKSIPEELPNVPEPPRP